MTTVFQPGDLVAPNAVLPELAQGRYYQVSSVCGMPGDLNLTLEGQIGAWPVCYFTLLTRRGAEPSPLPLALSRRDYFAGQALLGLAWHDTLTSWDDEHPNKIVLAREDLVREAVELADALVAELDRKGGAE